MSVKLNDELISIKCQMSALSKTAKDDNFDAAQWNELTAKRDEIENKLEAAKLVAQEQASSFSYETPKEAPKYVAAEVNHAVEQKDGFNKDDKKGYSCGGDLMADHIAFQMYGQTGDKFRNERYTSYLQSTNSIEVEQASGNASTVIDGVEIVADLQPGIRERGAGSGAEVLNMFNPIKTARKEVDFYLNEDTYNVDGLTVSRVSEGGTLTAQNFSNKLERFRLFKTGVFASITEEDLQNVPLLESRYMKRAPEVLGIQKIQDIISGDGLAKPLGFTNADSLLTVTRTGASAIAYADLCNMEGRVKRSPGSNYFYMANENAIPQLCQLKDDAGNRIWQNDTHGGILNGSIFHGTLNGRPLLISEDAPLMAAAGGLMLVSSAGYIFAEHTSGVRFAESMHFYFDTDKKAMRWLSQYGGRPVFTSAYQPRNASAPTLSHFVQIGA